MLANARLPPGRPRDAAQRVGIGRGPGRATQGEGGGGGDGDGEAVTDWTTFLKRVSLRPSFPLRLEHRTVRGEGQLVALLDAPDIHTGEMQTVHIMWPIPDRMPIDDDKAAITFVRALLRDALEHELDECLLLDGVQVRDPHAARHTDPR